MAAIKFDEGLQDFLARAYGQSIGSPVATIRLYTAIAPAMSKDTVKANFTEVTATMGYTAKAVNGTDFAFVTDVTNHWCTGSAAYTWTFTAGAGLTILGWYALNGTGAKAIEGEQFTTAITIPPAGGTLQVTINDKYREC